VPADKQTNRVVTPGDNQHVVRSGEGPLSPTKFMYRDSRDSADHPTKWQRMLVASLQSTSRGWMG
jgi:hypothetical protein